MQLLDEIARREMPRVLYQELGGARGEGLCDHIGAHEVAGDAELGAGPEGDADGVAFEVGAAPGADLARGQRRGEGGGRGGQREERDGEARREHRENLGRTVCAGVLRSLL